MHVNDTLGDRWMYVWDEQTDGGVAKGLGWAGWAGWVD